MAVKLKINDKNPQFLRFSNITNAKVFFVNLVLKEFNMLPIPETYQSYEDQFLTDKIDINTYVYKVSKLAFPNPNAFKHNLNDKISNPCKKNSNL